MFWDHDAKPLTDVECQDLLASVNVGRLSLTIGALPVIVPVTYWYFRGSVILGMGDGPAYRAAVANVVGLEIDGTNLEHVLWAVLVIGRTTEIIHPAEHAELLHLGLAAPSGTTHAHYVRLRPDIITGYRTNDGSVTPAIRGTKRTVGPSA